MKPLYFPKHIFISTINYLFVLLFVYAAASKLLDFNTFQNQLGQSPVLSAYAHIISWAVPITEIGIAILLVTKKHHELGLYGFYMMMVMFTTYIIIILNFTSFTPCSCGGVLEKLGWTEHLIFNIVFVILSCCSIFLKSQNKKFTLLKLSVVTVLNIGIVIFIFLSSENKMKHNNAFIRRFIPHPIEKIGEFELSSNAYYIAGMDDGNIYLGNYNAPLFLMQLSTSLNIANEYRISIDSIHLPYQKVRISVNPPYYFLGDGKVPILFRGNVDNWNAKIFSYKNAYFNDYVVTDSTHIGITTVSSTTKSKILGILIKEQDTINVNLNNDILIRQSKYNTFDSNGILVWNNKHNCFLYVYHYRNSYEVIDQNLSKQYTNKTIDTISKAVVDVAHYTKKDIYKLGANTILVNRLCSTDGDYLYINSDRLGRYENEKVLRSAGIIDVYDITNNTYAFSFYLYFQPHKKLNEFKIHNNLLVAIVDNKLWLYRLKPEYFNLGTNVTNTAQFQEEDRTPVEKSRSQIN